MVETRRSARSEGEFRGNATAGPSSGTSSRDVSTSRPGSRPSSRLSSRAKGKGKALPPDVDDSEDVLSGSSRPKDEGGDDDDYIFDGDSEEEDSELVLAQLEELEVDTLLRGDDEATQNFEVITIGTDESGSQEKINLYDLVQEKLSKGEIDMNSLKKRGKTRMNPPPKAPRAVAIRCIPEKWMIKKVKERVRNSLRYDENLDTRGLIYGIFADHKQHLVDRLLLSFQTIDNDMFRVHSALTGELLRFDSGPTSISLEAVYPFGITPSQRLGYHVESNVVFIESFFNFAKNNQSILVLPLSAEMMRVSADKTIPAKERQERMRWLDNATTKLALLHKKYSVKSNFMVRFQEWDRMHSQGVDMGAIVEELRTGRLVDWEFGEEDLSTISPSSSLRAQAGCWARQKDDLTVSVLKKNLLRIATERYGLTEEQFLFFCTIETDGEWVFFPFSPSARSTAKAISWDWKVLRDWACVRLRYFKDECDFWAFVCGIQDKGLCAAMLVYCVAHFTCQRLQEEIKSCETRSMNISDPAVLEEISYSITARWGVPVVPWRYHPFSAVFCKRDEHGTVMHTGFGDKLVTDSDFDPVWDFDPKVCTITVDATIVNNAMVNYDPSTWDSLHKTFMQVPVQGPLWDIDPTLGDSISGVSDAERSTRPPGKEYSSSVLLAIDPWLDASVVHNLGCVFCPATCKDIGDLNLHYLNEHNRARTIACGWAGCGRKFHSEGDLRHHSMEHQGDAEAVQYWQNFCVCPYGCMNGQPFFGESTFRRHMNGCHFAGGSQECPEQNCSETFHDRSKLQFHLFQAHDICQAVESCAKCGRLFSGIYSSKSRDRHEAGAHKHKCDNCELTFLKKIDLNAHVVLSYPDSEEANHIQNGPKQDRPARCAECGIFMSLTSLPGHLKSKHWDIRMECPICPESSGQYATAHTTRQHLKEEHSDKWCPECWCIFNVCSDIDRHRVKWHGELLIVTPSRDNTDTGEPSHTETIQAVAALDDTRDHPSCGVEGKWKRDTDKGWYTAVEGGPKCLLCDEKLSAPTLKKTREKMQNHLNRNHPLCPVQGCEFRCKNLGDLGRHKNSHSHCSQCDKWFLDDDVRDRHPCGEIPPWEERPLPQDLQEAIAAIPPKMIARPSVIRLESTAATPGPSSTTARVKVKDHGAGSGGGSAASGPETPVKRHAKVSSIPYFPTFVPY